MALKAGSRFGAFEILEPLGEGGMGEVYRARDSELERDIAIKVLPDSFVSDETRVARFEQEAKTLAALNHANIAQVFGLARADGRTAIVMELVEGPTLADRIAQGPLPADEALGIARQIADALEAAHEQRIVHRDLKPANVKLRPDGTVKVLDFGIAKALAPELVTSSVSPVMTTPVTQIGVILGTAAYMSPEQARGKPVDRRTDIWAFGCVLYEMLTAQPAFGGEDVPLTLARVLAHGTNIDSLPGNVSPAVRHTIAMCLEKDPKKRIADISDVRLALEGRFESEHFGDAVEARARGWRRALPAAGALVLGGLIVGFASFWLKPEPESRPVNRFAHQMPQGEFFRNTGRNVIALSPDGRRIIYNSDRGFVLREFDSLTVRVIAGTEGDVTNPFFSPDGQSVGFWTRAGELRRVAIGGGASRILAQGLGNLYGAFWAADGRILFGDGGDIYSVAADGGAVELLVEAGAEEALASPVLLPDGNTLLLTANAGLSNWDNSAIVAHSLDTGARSTLIIGGRDAKYVAGGHLIFGLRGELFAVPFDADALEITGSTVPVATQVATAEFTASLNYDIGADGTLIYLSGVNSSLVRELVWVDRQGKETGIVGAAAMHWNPRISPDGANLAVELASDVNDGIEVYDLVRGGAPTRISFDSGVENRPLWTPDSASLLYQSEGPDLGLIMRSADATGAETEILEDLPGGDLTPESFTQDGNELIMRVAGLSLDLYRYSFDDDTAEPLLSEAWNEGFSSLSPNGSWLAYSSDESGQWEVYVRPYPEVNSRRIKVSTDYGIEPLWHPDGSELYYVNRDRIMAVEVDEMSDQPFGIPEALFTMSTNYVIDSPVTVPNWDIHPDGDRFIMLKPVGGDMTDAPASIVIVQNWLDGLGQLAPRAR